MQQYFDLGEFIKLGGIRADIAIPAETFDKILSGFLLPLNDLRSQLGRPIHVTSSYRPTWWEEIRGRDGTSQHTFQGKGAADVALSNEKTGTWILFFEHLAAGPWTRIAYYPNNDFFHLDYKADSRQYFVSDGGWQSSTESEIRTLIRNG